VVGREKFYHSELSFSNSSLPTARIDLLYCFGKQYNRRCHWLKSETALSDTSYLVVGREKFYHSELSFSNSSLPTARIDLLH
jgi:hypothetical protein